ncbi:uncharacterized protein HD556DRAFT_1306465 [Suillus plorans]|uniref:Uncharacterized protein n=1 Tax=Suillus plorans TaxID=116603 RepID=A0A9P7DLP9_9AGAM|nr:uncharacterized protein HD556DRAFT_1306465 [Suillus plorans]KAG1797886.1 hypothetical protein HD556DRAFT_1306465 [Suillus plorans]
MGHRRGKLVASTDPNYKSRIQDAPVDVTICKSTQGSCNTNFIVQVAQQSLKDHSRGSCRGLAIQLLRIEKDIKTKVFDGSLSLYGRKDDLITIAGALSLPRDGTMIELTA